MTTHRPLDPRHLKRVVSILDVLAPRGLAAGLRRRGQRLVGTCPVHHGDNPNAFVVDPTKNLWFCFTGCAAGGDVIDLVRRLDGASFPKALHTLAELTSTPQPPAHDTPRPVDQTVRFQPYLRSLRLDPSAPFLRDKRIHPNTARAFDAGLWAGPGFLRDCVAVRLHDPQGHPLGYAGRRLRDHEIQRLGKWKLPPRLPKSRLLYNYHRVRTRLHAEGLVLVECPWGVMRLHQIGLPAVALLGTALSPQQHHLLASARRIVLMLDADPAGYAATTRILPTLPPTARPVVAPLPHGADPDDLTDDALRNLAEPLLR